MEEEDEVVGVEEVDEAVGVADVDEVVGVEEVFEVGGVKDVDEIVGVEKVDEIVGVEEVFQVGGVEDVEGEIWEVASAENEEEEETEVDPKQPGRFSGNEPWTWGAESDELFWDGKVGQNRVVFSMVLASGRFCDENW